MQQNYIIFIDNRSLTINCDPRLKNEIILEFDENIQVAKKSDDLERMVKYWVEEVESGSTEYVIFTTDDVPGLYKMIENCYNKLILAAGGLVLNDNNEVLVIFRNGKWDLPKGKVEEGEFVEQAAVREVKEETGLKSLKVMSQLSRTYHTYSLKNKGVLKETFWYLMASNDTELRPQIKEGITKVLWIPISKLESVFSNTYPNIKIVLKEIL